MSNTPDKSDEGRVRLDRRVPVQVLAVLGGQLLLAIWAYAMLTAEVRGHGAWIEENKPAVERLARLEERVGAMQESLSRIEALLLERD
jgi:hypothetical protein